MHFLTLVQFKQDGTFERSTSGYNSIDEAEQAFHQAMVSVISKSEYNKAIMFVFDSEGTIKFKRVWERQ